MAARPEVGIASASIRLADDPDLLNSAGNPVHFLGFCWSGAFGEPAANYPVEAEVLSAAGTAMALRRPCGTTSAASPRSTSPTTRTQN